MTPETRYLLVMNRLEAIKQRMDWEMGWHTLGFVGVMTVIVLSLYLLLCLLCKRRPAPAALTLIAALGLLAAVAVCIRYF